MPGRYDVLMRPLDIALATLAAARLSRFVITDEMGEWWVKQPIDRAMDAYAEREMWASANVGQTPREPWWWKYRSGLDCPFCVGFWLGAAVLTTGAAATRLPGPAAAAWRLGAGALALNYAAAHLGVRLGDFDTATDDEDDDR